MGLNQLTIVTHTHTDCKTLWEPYFDSYAEFFNHDKHIVLINKASEEITNKQIVYSEMDNNAIYNKIIPNF
jgi:homoserine dehydrogenase